MYFAYASVCTCAMAHMWLLEDHSLQEGAHSLLLPYESWGLNLNYQTCLTTHASTY